MRIAVIQPRLSYFNGGGERNPMDAISHLSQLLKIDFDLYTTKSPLPYSLDYLSFKNSVSNSKNVNIYELPTPLRFIHIYNTIPGESRYRWDVESMYFNNLIYPEITKKPPDLLLSYYLPDCVYKPSKIPSLLYLLGYPRTDSEYRNAMIDQYNGIVAITKNTLDQWNLRLTNKITKYDILHQGLNTEIKTNKVDSFLGNEFNVLFAGRLIERKGILTLLNAIKLCCDSTSNIKLHIVGEGPFLGDIQNFITSNNLEKFVVMHGFKNNILDYIFSADLCVYPSHEGEGLMNVVLESMYYNGLVLTTYGNGNEEVINNNLNGFLIRPRNPSQLKEKICEIQKNYSKLTLVRKNAKTTISNDFTWEKHAEKFILICNKLLREFIS